MTFKHLVHECLYAYPRWQYRRKASKGIPVSVTLPGGVNVRLHPWGQIAEFLSVGGFERTELSLTASFLKEEMNVIDIGANVGLYSILAAGRIGPSGRVWSFEPSSQTYEHLVMNLALNNAGTVTANRLALSDVASGELSLRRSPGRGDAERYLSMFPNHPSIRDGGQDDPGDSELVQVTSLDTYAQQHLGGVRIDFIKLDVEGCEYPVLQGAKDTLMANRGVLLMFECSSQGCQWSGKRQEDVFDLLRGMGFHLFCWDDRHHQWVTDQLTGNVWAARDPKRLPQPA